ncbi:hypothetical protein [Arthrobacter sp. AET 35A]|uniref:hypothetical protein n=1 Tax=Arthrobacter sp. AET 35A TaxID=2292643 RepID=UPI0017859048|nr:hypothetical protein [Arthrobacter sp. AET 35A]MBE0011079.1 hypothetical protein [Arthrobacter sp. AET 35A]
MPYTAHKPPPVHSNEELRAAVPGWGADLDPKDRPSVPKEQFDPNFSGAHWEFPEHQPEKWPRERSIEHKVLTPVFGTITPPRGLSGAIRRYSYKKYSEGRTAHWLLLIAADRVDAWEHHLGSFLSLRPDNPITETGVRSEFTRHGLTSRTGTKRVDLKHQWIDPIMIGAPWVVMGGLAIAAARRLARLRQAQP